jgi:Protein of unknown function (DUF998)
MVAALLGLICVAASGAILIALHFLPTGLDPIRYAVSDYGWTAYHLGYRAMVVLQGVGAILIAVGLGQETDAQSLGWLYVYGVVRILISRFMTDREPEGMLSLTRTGRIHMLLAGTAFAAIAVAASHLDWTEKPDVLGPLGWLVTATAIATATALVVEPIRRAALGLIERLFYAASIVWLIVVAASIV